MAVLGQLHLYLKFTEALNNSKYVCNKFLSEQLGIQSR
jgi:hypothetical protein